MIAVFVNCGTIVLGSLLGLLFSRKIGDELSNVVQTAAGVVTVVLGVEMAFEYQNIIFLAVALIGGGIVGSLLDVDGKILRLGELLGKLVPRRRQGPLSSGCVETGHPVSHEGDDTSVGGHGFAYAFLNASVLFCVGAMSIIGSLNAGIDGDYTIIFTKSVLDGFMAIVFTAAMGVGTMFSALTVLLYQGSLTLLAGFVAPYADEILVAELTASGGAMIIMIGINLLGLRKIKTANYLPAIVFSVVFVLIQRVFA